MTPMMRLVGLTLAICTLLSREAAAEPLRPGHESARTNAHGIFNDVHSAGRQWGSSIDHNGLGLFPAVVPKGTLLYHGARSNQTPTEPEWLAFDAELSENFALSSKLQKLGAGGQGTGMAPAQKPLGHAPFSKTNGHLQTYRAQRNLDLVYFDGMSSAKTSMGILDTQDLLMSGVRDRSSLDERVRVRDICGLVTEW